MVKDTGKLDAIVTAIRDWFSTLPSGVAHLTEEQHEYELVLAVTPTNPKGCSIELRVSYYGTFGLYLGRGFAFEDIPSSIELVLDICESVRRGDVKEEVWEWRGKIIKTRGCLKLSTRQLTDRGSSHWAAWLPVGTRRQVQYEPWGQTNEDGTRATS
jgi:hypothetical protein